MGPVTLPSHENARHPPGGVGEKCKGRHLQDPAFSKPDFFFYNNKRLSYCDLVRLALLLRGV